MNRFFSSLVFTVCLVVAHRVEGGEGVFVLMAWLVWPMGLIWFGDVLGSALGFNALHPVDRESPGCVVKLLGWLFLLGGLGYALTLVYGGS